MNCLYSQKNLCNEVSRKEFQITPSTFEKKKQDDQKDKYHPPNNIFLIN
jgi:hypothetical protein